MKSVKDIVNNNTTDIHDDKHRQMNTLWSIVSSNTMLKMKIFPTKMVLTGMKFSRFCNEYLRGIKGGENT